ncbi:glycosyltransferase family 4 protein [Desulfovulcanus sp.]
MRILHVLSQRPDSTGSGIYIRAMIKEAIKKGHKNYLLAGLPKGEDLGHHELDPECSSFVYFQGQDLSFPIVGMSDVMPYPSKRFCDLTRDELEAYENCFAAKVKAMVQSFKPDIIHTHHLWLVSALVRELFPHLPQVTTCHGSDLRQFQSCAHLQERVLGPCKKIDAVLALSRAQKDDIMRFYQIEERKIHVVGAGYNDNLFCPEIKPTPPPVHLVYAGKLSKAKGVPWLLKALLRLLEEGEEFVLHLVGGGSGTEKEMCLQFAEKFGSSCKVYGLISQQELARVLKQGHIFVLPSFFEGLPLVLLEALACGCRLVATRLPGVLEVLGTKVHDYIALVPLPRLEQVDVPVQEDEEIFVQNLGQGLKRQIKAVQRNAQLDLTRVENLLKFYSWSAVFERVQRVYDSVFKS